MDVNNNPPKAFIFDIFGVLCNLEDGKVNQEIFKEIEKLRTNYKVAVLSNSDGLLVRSRFEKQNFPLEKYFDFIFISSEIDLLKPNPESFNYCLEMMKIKPEEVIFIDDSSVNLLGAEWLGIKTYKYKNFKLFKDWLIKSNF